MITVIRLGHRGERDKRVTTHCALAARALGADKIIICGEEDPTVVESVRKVVAKWGGNFKIESSASWKSAIKREKKRGLVVHLTFYGENFETAVRKLKKLKPKNLAVVIGAEKVPSEVYRLADFNISIGNQPHSEVAALALFLYKLVEKDLYKKEKNAKIAISPSKGGKNVAKF